MNNQMNNAVRKIHNLLSSGAVTVTGPNQPRILKQKVGSTTVTPSNNLQQQQQLANSSNRCYVCDEALGASQAQHPLTEMQTSHTATKFPNKIGQLVGDAFMVIVSVEDVVCSRCTNLLNYLDRLENDVERVRTNLMNLLHKKYGLNDEGGGGGSGGGAGATSPPIKMQKLNSGGTVTRSATDDSIDGNRTRKVLHGGTDSPVAAKQSPPVYSTVSAVHQIKISTQQQVQQQQLAAGTQTLQRKTTKIYKCLSCDYKTSDMRLFNTHYETCKHQNFQCKNCKKIFPNFGAMKQHMVREHNTPMDNTCSVCHYNFVNEIALRKHMEINHSTNVIVTSTTTIPAGAAAPAAVPVASADATATSPTTTSLYTCNHCQFKSTDKSIFDEHLRKHLSGTKPKPFKCRLCAQRFETREAATVHAKQHQPNYFKCGTCSMSFSKRELLVKHFEVHQQAATPPSQPQQVTTTVKQQTPAALTQKLLQETINEALSESVGAAGTADLGTAANNIRFFSCHICSLTFIQENYYNQHMETHRRGDKKGAAAVATTLSNNTSPLTTLSVGAALLGEGGLSKVEEPSNVATSEQANSNTVGGAAGISEADIESIFEKMHSDKSDSANADSIAASSAANTTTKSSAATVSGGKTGDNLVITSQQSSGGITFNITIPQPDVSEPVSREKTTAPVSVSIDMPVLDQSDEAEPVASSIKSQVESQREIKSMDKDDDSGSGGAANSASSASGPVSMPSLDDDNETQEHASAEAETSDDSPAAAAASQTDSKSVHEEINRDEKSKNETQEEDQNETESSGKDDTTASGAEGEEGEQAERDAAADAEEAEATASEEMVDASGNPDQQVAMELDEAMQAQVESGQIKFILNENGQILQLDNNHIITDAEGNQILVQDPEQIQQLLQSVGVLQSGDGLDGETLQMMTDANGQMVLVQGENNETQLIDASLLNADGQLVIQQGQDGELGEGAHVIGEDGTRIPVSVSYTADGQPIVQVQQRVLEATDGEDAQHDVLEKDTDTATAAEDDAEPQAADAAGGDGTDNTAGSYFALEELMQPQSSDAKAAE